jgi:hypothetical protein
MLNKLIFKGGDFMADKARSDCNIVSTTNGQSWCDEHEHFVDADEAESERRKAESNRN